MPATNLASRVQPERHIPEYCLKAARQLRAETVAGGFVRAIVESSSVVRRLARRLWERADSVDPQRWTGTHQRTPGA